MSRSNLLAPLLVSAATVFSGAAHTQPQKTETLEEAAKRFATQVKEEWAKTEEAHRARIMQIIQAKAMEVNPELKVRVDNPANQKIVGECFKEWNIQDNQLHKLSAAKTLQGINCIDEKNVAEFLADPSKKRSEVSILFEQKSDVAQRLQDNRWFDFPKRVAEQCQPKDNVQLPEFKNCAISVSNQDNFIIFGIFAIAGVAACVGTAPLRRTSKRKDTIGNEPS